MIVDMAPQDSRAPLSLPRRRRKKRRGRRRRKAIRAARNVVLARVIAGVSAVIGRLPLTMGLRTGAALGGGAYRMLGRERRRALDHLAVALPEIEPRAREYLARETFRNAGRSFAELAQWPRMRGRIDEMVTVEGADILDRGLAMRRGLLAVTGHIGNWELLAAVIAARNYPLYVIARRVNDDNFDALVSGFRARAGLRTIMRDDTNAVREALRALRGGNLLAVLVDQDSDGPGVFVPFFGRAARTSPGAAIIALRSRVPVVSIFIERRARGQHIRVSPLYGFETVADVRPTPEELTARFAGAIESQIRRSPSEWVWWHRRWRRRPPAVEGPWDVRPESFKN